MLLVRTRTRVARETGRVLVRFVQRDGFRPGPPDVVPDVPHAPDLIVHVPEHRVVRMARIAGAFRGNPPVLEMRRRQKPPVIDVKTLFVGPIDVAGDAEFRGLGLFVVLRGSTEQRHAGQQEKREEREDHAAGRGGKIGPPQDYRDHGQRNGRQDDQGDGKSGHSGHSVRLLSPVAMAASVDSIVQAAATAPATYSAEPRRPASSRRSRESALISARSCTISLHPYHSA